MCLRHVSPFFFQPRLPAQGVLRLDIKDVEKDVRLINTGSGGVDVSGVKGRVIRDR
jgi:hypothetical protein